MQCLFSRRISREAIEIGNELLLKVDRVFRHFFLYCRRSRFSFAFGNQDVKQYEDKMLELEKSWKWKIFSKQKTPYFCNVKTK